MKIFGILGHPLGHSFSPAYFKKRFADEGIDADYLMFDLDDISLLPATLDKYGNDLTGFNVTIPYKQAVMQFLDGLSPEAEAIGAVNVVKVTWQGDRRILTGYNTDVIGFTKSIRPMLEQCTMHNAQCTIKAFILGTGGASKAVNHALRQMGLKPTLVSRTKRDDTITYDQLEEYLKNPPSHCDEVPWERILFVNTTPLGMFPGTDTCPPIPYIYIKEGDVAFDLVYNPEQTLFMKRCAGQGAKVKSGLEMLHLQAETAWKIWNNIK